MRGEPIFLRRLLPDTLWFRFPVHDEFRIHTAKQLAHMAVPADWAMGGKQGGKLLGAHFFPLNRFVVWSEQGWCMIQVVEFFKRLATNRTGFSFIPVRNDIPHEAVLRIWFDLLQTLLAAILAPRPTRALLQAQSWLGQESAHCSLAGSYVHGFCFEILWASDEALASVRKICADAWDRTEYK